MNLPTHTLICWLKTIWRTLSTGGWQGGFVFDAHEWVDQEEYENCKVTVSKCEVCGKVEISWESDNGLTTPNL